jgi:hypothetical protein
MSELKAGDSQTLTVAGQTLTIEPLPFGQIKKVTQMIFHMAQEVNAKKAVAQDILLALPEIVEKYIDDFVPMLFRKGTHAFLTKEWVNENLTVPQLRLIVEASIKVNGLEDFFPKGAAGPANGNLPASAPPLATVGSITSSGSVTDGGLKT